MTPKTINRLFLAGRLAEPVYAGIMILRSVLYEKGLFRTHRIGVPVISIGNLLMGGTGKTPHVTALCRFLEQQGFVPAVVTRGYGGKAGRGPLIVSDGTRVKVSAGEAGDEPFMMALEMPGVPVIAGSCRSEGAKTAIRQCGATIIVLDDGFQHMALSRQRNVVLVPARRPFGNGHVFPGGRLREPVSALDRATCIVITGCQQVTAAEADFLKIRLHDLVPGKPVFLSRNIPVGIRTLRSREPGPVTAWRKRPLFAFCGLALPESFFEILEQNHLSVTGTMVFRDHHPYSAGDLMEIYRSAEKSGAHALITTAKDAVKLEELLQNQYRDHHSTGASDMKVLVLEIEAVPEQGFWKHITTGITA